MRDREARTLEITRQLQARAPDILPKVEAPDIQELRRKLGDNTALIEYTMIDHELLAFVVTGESVEVVRGLASERELEREVAQFRFQINTLSYGVKRMRRHLPRLTERVLVHLQSLYGLLRKSQALKVAVQRGLREPLQA